MITNKVGLEAEFFLTDKDGKLVFPPKCEFGTDNLAILGEIRGAPGSSRSETLAEFSKAYYVAVYKARAMNCTVNLCGHTSVDAKTYSEILKRSGPKEFPECKNIYGTDITEYSDANIVDGRIISHEISAGLHVHFSSGESQFIDVTQPSYSRVVLPVSYEPLIPNSKPINIELYREQGYSTSKKLSVSCSRITVPVIRYFVFQMDQMLKEYQMEVSLKYRQPGFYEIKPYGFEYRSLPFSRKVYNDLDRIVDKAFNLLEEL